MAMARGKQNPRWAPSHLFDVLERLALRGNLLLLGDVGAEGGDALHGVPGCRQGEGECVCMCGREGGGRKSTRWHPTSFVSKPPPPPLLYHPYPICPSLDAHHMETVSAAPRTTQVKKTRTCEERVESECERMGMELSCPSLPKPRGKSTSSLLDPLTWMVFEMARPTAALLRVSLRPTESMQVARTMMAPKKSHLRRRRKSERRLLVCLLAYMKTAADSRSRSKSGPASRLKRGLALLAQQGCH
jgi:hypothetical protein